MNEEKRVGRFRWLSHDDLKFRIKEVDSNISIIWVSKFGTDICFVLSLYDFSDRCREDMNLSFEYDSSWKQQGFKVKNSDIDILLGEIVRFINEWEIETDATLEKFSDEEWYSI